MITRKKVKKKKEHKTIFMGSQPYCACGLPMKVKFSGSGPFWSCPLWPKGCGQTRSAPTSPSN
jgi:hypothetical protein